MNKRAQFYLNQGWKTETVARVIVEYEDNEDITDSLAKLDDELASLRQRIEELEAERERLRNIINFVEWFASYGDTLLCPWCCRSYDMGHAKDCIRRAALGDE